LCWCMEAGEVGGALISLENENHQTAPAGFFLWCQNLRKGVSENVKRRKTGKTYKTEGFTGDF